MYKYTILALLFGGSSSELLTIQENSIEFVIIVPSYNNANYVKENLDSLCWQNSTHPYQIIYINDCSSDNTGYIVEEYISKHNLVHKVRLINNQERRGSGIANIYHAIHNFVDDNKIAVIVDGDDLLPHNNVLATLEKYYNNQDVWMTYSKLQYYPSGKIYCKKVEDWIYREHKTNMRAIRTHSEWLPALRTFRSSLFKKLKKQDLCYKGEFMTVSWDDAFCLPMLEMCSTESSCGLSHSVFIDEILYIYRINNPLSDATIRKQLQIDVELYIRNQLEPYAPLQSID